MKTLQIITIVLNLIAFILLFYSVSKSIKIEKHFNLLEDQRDEWNKTIVYLVEQFRKVKITFPLSASLIITSTLIKLCESIVYLKTPFYNITNILILVLIITLIYILKAIITYTKNLKTTIEEYKKDIRNMIPVTIHGNYEICKRIIKSALQTKSILENLTEKDTTELKRLFFEEATYNKWPNNNIWIKNINIKVNKNTVTALVNLANAAEKTNWETIKQNAKNNEELEQMLRINHFAAINNPDEMPKEMDPFITPITVLAFSLSQKIGLNTSVVPPYDTFRKRESEDI